MKLLHRLLRSVVPEEELVLAEPARTQYSLMTPAHSPYLHYAQASDVGKTRKNNQDSCTSFAVSYHGPEGPSRFGLFVVADGMGGHVDGEKASSLCIRVMTQHIMEHAYLPLLNTPEQEAPPDFIQVINHAVEAANLAVTQQIPNGGTTLTVFLVHDDQAYISQVGDSRAYLIDNNHLKPLTRDHSLVQRLVELKQLTPEQAADHPHRNILYRAIGQAEYIELDTAAISLPMPTRLLLCSDGLWTVVPEATIMQILDEAPDLQTACDRLVDKANAHGGPDNVTVVLVEVPLSNDLVE